jgi:nucleotide exchange factor SIL1
MENGLSIVDRNDDNIDESEVTIDDNENEETDDSNSEPFIASKEWQTIKKGQIIPAGLHVRLNLETGLKEAKILDENNDEFDINSKFVDKHKKVVQKESETTLKSNAIRDQIKEVLKNLKFGQQLKDSDKSSSNFRSIDEIKKEFNEINFKMSSETELLKDLIEKYEKSSIDQKLSILYDIEYLVHSIDLAQDFVKLNGIDLLLGDLNSTNSNLRAQIAFTIGSAMNSNPKVQIQVLKSGALHKLLLLLRYDSSNQVKKRALFAISSLVRHFPIAQKALIQEYGALSIFSNLFKNSDIDSLKLSLKVITLLNDLLIEHQLTSKYAKNDELSQIKLKQYQEIDLKRALVEEGFCELVPQLLNSPDNEARERTIEAMMTFLSLCKKEFINSLPILQQISIQFNEMVSDASDDYFANLYHLTNNLINKLNSNIKQEL